MKGNAEFEIKLPARARALGQLPGYFVVKYDTECAKCRTPIYEREWARMTDDGVMCSGCGAEVD